MDFIANPQPTEQIVPAVGSLDDPTPRLEARIALAFLLFLASRFHVRDVPAPLGGTPQLRVVVALVAAKMLARFLIGRGAWDYQCVQRRAELLHVVPVGARQRGGQRNPVGIGEVVPFGAQFSAICRVFSGLVAPLTGAGMMAESSDWKRQSIPLRSS